MDAQVKPTLLIIDDAAAESLAMLSEVLVPLYRVRAANSGEAGLRLARNAPMPALILLDMMMPGQVGYAVLADRGKHFDPDVTDVFAAGFDDFVSIANRHQEGC